MTDFLFELGCEEIPAKHLAKLSTALENGLIDGLQKSGLSFTDKKSFATPRRLGILISGLPASQPTQKLEKKGPSIAIGLDDQGQPTPALVKFAEGLGISPEKLERRQTDKGEFFYYEAAMPGKKTAEILPDIINEAFKKLPLPKPMRWSSHSFEFLRPVRWIVSLFDGEILPLTLFGVQADRYTYGHRFHASGKIILKHPSDYEAALEKAYVIANRAKRQAKITQGIEQLEKTHHYTVEKSEDLIIEVTDLVEWPVVLQGSFEERFLKVPAEALSTSMRSHQKSFSVSRDNKILPHFIFVSNIEATDPSTIVKGNEKVMRARLSDALFFYEADLKTDMNTWLERLKTVTFQEGLGSLRERSNRLKWLTQNIWIALYHKGLSTEGFANPTKKNNAVVQRGINNDGQFQFFLDAGLYSKCDLMSSMVYEFPELQGIMGYYYAKSKGFNDSVCIALRDQYLPAFAGDELPKFDDMVPVCLALANKLDQLVGVFCIIKKIPTGDKDPFGLRRATVGIIRILVERNIPHSIHRLIEESVKVYKNNEPLSLWETSGEGFIIQLKNYIFERFKFYCLDQGISQSVINAVLAVQFDNLTDALEWMKSIELFLKENSEAKSLLNNYKRLNNLLRKENIGNPNSVSRIDFSLLGAAEEEAIEEACRDVHGLDETSSQNMYGLNNENKRKHLQSLASSFMLPLQNFFDNIRVDVEDKDRKKIRLDLLTNSRWYFLQIADFSLIDINESV